MVEIEGDGVAPELPQCGENLVALMSFAVVRGFGSVHPLIALADRFADLGVRMDPLTTFYENGADDREDEQNLERAWQDAATLAASLRSIWGGLRDDEMAAALARKAGAEGLVDEVEVLLPYMEEAASSGRNVRLTYDL